MSTLISNKRYRLRYILQPEAQRCEGAYLGGRSSSQTATV